ncbi:MAG: WYL domain-containing protein [Casimicrobium sp.]
MPQRPPGLETLQLALQLLKNIPRNKFVSTSDMQNRLDAQGIKRDLRTVQRQLDMLAEAFDIERDTRSKPYGYKWKSAAKPLSLPGLSASESLVLAMGQAHLSQLMPARVRKEMGAFFEQADNNLRQFDTTGKSPKVQKERAWLKKVRVVPVTQPLLPPTIQPGVFEAVSDALFHDHWLAVKYTNAAGKQHDANVMPLGLAQQGVRLFLVCRYEKHEDERALALHRIQTAKDTQRAFERPADFDLERYDSEGRFGFGEGKLIKLKITVSDFYRLILEETPLSKDQTIDLIRGRNIVTATVVESQQLVWWLRGLGDEATVLSPRALLR